ncbi:MAG: hypothetical protein ACP5K5_00385 [Candidatus Micrarchaeia archaeon]
MGEATLDKKRMKLAWEVFDIYINNLENKPLVDYLEKRLVSAGINAEELKRLTNMEFHNISESDFDIMMVNQARPNMLAPTGGDVLLWITQKIDFMIDNHYLPLKEAISKLDENTVESILEELHKIRHPILSKMLRKS